MSATAPGLPDEFLDTAAASALTGLSVSTFERHRCQGTGCKYLKLGPGKRAKVVYRRSDLLAWINQFEYRSTSEYGR